MALFNLSDSSYSNIFKALVADFLVVRSADEENKPNQTNQKLSVDSYNDMQSNGILNKFWSKLIFSSEEDKAISPDTNISKLLEEQKIVSSNYIIEQTLSEKLNVEINSPTLKQAMEKSNKIYHEDFPGDFILELDGDRIGLFLIDTCYDSQQNPRLNYKFKPGIKSFKGLF